MNKIKLANKQIPLHFQITEYLVVMLKQGDLKPDENLPPEEKLKDMFDVSRTTIRHALDHLLQKGLLYKKQGKGTFWTDKAAELVKFNKQAGKNREIFNVTDKTQVMEVEKLNEIAGNAICNFLSLPQDSEVTTFKRLRSHDDEPMSYTVNYLPVKYGSMINESHLSDKTMLEALEQVARVQLGVIEHEVEITRADDEKARALGVSVLDPLLTVCTKVYDIESEPVEIVWTYFVENKYKFRVVLDK